MAADSGLRERLKKLDVKTTRRIAAIAIGTLAVVIGAIALIGADSGSSEDGGESNAVALTVPQLLAQVSEIGEVVYWAGPRAGTTSYELSSTADGSVYVRYLTDDAEAGNPRAEFLTIGTYPVAGARASLGEAEEGDAAGRTLSRHDGYQALSSPDAASAYVVFADQPDLQIEVFSPQPGEAAQLAKSGAVRPVG